MSTRRIPTTQSYDLFKAAVTFILLFIVLIAVALNSRSTQAAETEAQPTLDPVVEVPPAIGDSDVVGAGTSTTSPDPTAVLTPVSVETETATPTPEGTEMSGDGLDYIVQQGDWLMGLAREFYGDASRWEDIFNATNAKVAEDASYATIENPNALILGWKIWIPLP
jgi:nucleoid-associated protein YgaU